MKNFVVLLSAASIACGLQLLPPASSTPGHAPPSGSFDLASAPKSIYIDSTFAAVADSQGLTLIPPTALSFAESFRSDLYELFGANWTLHKVDGIPSNGSGIFLGGFTGNLSQLTYEDGRPTEEGYELTVSSNRVYIAGAGARGMWWGTRTLLQQLLLSNGTVPGTAIVDAPAYATRGFMLDAGRKYYAPSFLKELCTYASFFKLSEFHYHLSDNYPLNRGHNDTWNQVYSHFSLLPEDESLHGIVERPNETLSRADFSDFQQHCASHGVTVIPEIEAPGHCLYLTKWKPEMALDKKDLLNLSHPEAIPTVKRIWSEFLPWFHTKEVHIGADEYDSTLADDYIGFVNEMSSFIQSTSNKTIRIWGTYEPSENLTISKDVIIQHWQYGQSDPVQLHDEGYHLINSEDWWAYMSLKNDHMPINPAPYPQFFNTTRVFNFADKPDWQWTPADYNPVNTTQQLPAGARANKGAILAAWNDNGPDATTQLEAYYAMRQGIPLVGSRAWSGRRQPNNNITSAATLSATIDFLAPLVPGQNLDRRFQAPASTANTNDNDPTLFSWTRASTTNTNSTTAPIVLNPDDNASIGPPYTLHLTATGPFALRGPDTVLALTPSSSNASHTLLTFTTADGWPYPLRSVSAASAEAGERIWVNDTTSTHEPVRIAKLDGGRGRQQQAVVNLTVATDVLRGSRVWVDGVFAGRFEVFVFGGRNLEFSWSQMAFVAPVGEVEGLGGGGLVGVRGGGLVGVRVVKGVSEVPASPGEE
ncbi:beta-n-acetylhexosaminidase [Diplodia corticola]|uniref:beta-N-acetylhexosaminidase n=1 Tax=Diplodia corticola TaxID=236234 RepID=A0A1J9QY98_9PEZI|nr:beta-n-acetylhexosaminidase [Diplodia corticola]OJD34022.1 beta-n-acetylhexosaminidase [Diplodia corticola]